MTTAFVSAAARAVVLEAELLDRFELPCRHPLVSSLREDRGLRCSECDALVVKRETPR